jgi:DNA-binding helix-hairpin-helix protein with protein kinase domain
MRGASLCRHPDIDHIIRLVKAGQGARSIAAIINRKYTAAPRYQVNWITINDFIKNYLHLDKKQREALRAEAKSNGMVVTNNQIKDLAIQSRLNQKTDILDMQEILAERELDVREEMEKLYNTALAEIDAINDKVNKMDGRNFVAGKAALVAAIDQVRKIIGDVRIEQMESKASQQVANSQVVLNFNQINAHVDAIKQAVVETFREQGLMHQLPEFLNRLSGKLSKLSEVKVTTSTGETITVQHHGALNGGSCE